MSELFGHHFSKSDGDQPTNISHLVLKKIALHSH